MSNFYLIVFLANCIVLAFTKEFRQNRDSNEVYGNEHLGPTEAYELPILLYSAGKSSIKPKSRKSRDAKKRRCGPLLIKWVVRTCNGCIMPDGTKPADIRDKRSIGNFLG